MTDTPFFDPWPEPDQDQDDQQQEIDLPWLPPVHVVGQVVPVAATVFRSDDVAVVVTHVVAFQRGFEVHVGTWLRPGAHRDMTSTANIWREQEPRVGIRLADGTRLGHRPPSDPPPEEGPTSYFSQMSGNGGGLHSTSAWWVSPMPAGDALEAVVSWDHQGVPESSVRLDLPGLRTAAEHEVVLWDPPPPPPEEGYFGWAGPYPSGAYSSSWAMTLDEPERERDSS